MEQESDEEDEDFEQEWHELECEHCGNCEFENRCNKDPEHCPYNPENYED